MVSEKAAPSKTAKVDPVQKDEAGKDAAAAAANKAGDGKKKDEKTQATELSEDDKQLQDELNMLVERLQDENKDLYMPALEAMRNLIRASTTSMTSVPKPLKFMRPHFETMKEVYKTMPCQVTRELCANIISVLAMTMGTTGKECLVYRFLCNQADQIGDWGHEYVRHLTWEISQNWNETSENFRARLIDLVRQILPYNMAHNAEADACDLLMEIEQLELLEEFVDDNTFPRVCLYLQSCVPYVPDPENTTLLKTALKLYRKFAQYTQAMRLALMLNEVPLIEEVFNSCTDTSTRKQLAFMLVRQQIFIEVDQNAADYEDLVEILSNAHLNNHFLNLARELDIMEPKTPEDVYKSHLENSRTSSQVRKENTQPIAPRNPLKSRICLTAAAFFVSQSLF